MSHPDSFVQIRDLYFRRGERMICKGLDLDIPRGKITAIMGPSGTGKTTLLRLISRQLIAEQGTIVVDGQEVSSLNRRQLAAMRHKTGVLFQSGALFTDMTVFENVAFPLRYHSHLPEHMIHDLVTMKLHAVGLRGTGNLLPSQLSGGMARRVALARAIIMDPQMIMYDEPFTGLDPISLGVVKTLIVRLNRALGLTSLVISHDVNATVALADKLCVMIGGKIASMGTPDDIFSSDEPGIRQFIRGEPDGPVPFHHPAPDYQDVLLSPP